MLTRQIARSQERERATSGVKISLTDANAAPLIAVVDDR
jgi:hypothetical protein